MEISQRVKFAGLVARLMANPDMFLRDTAFVITNLDENNIEGEFVITGQLSKELRGVLKIEKDIK